MRWIVLIVGLPVAIGLSLVSMIANWRFGVRLGAETGDALAYGLASVCADGLKVILPFAIGWAWARRKPAEWLAAGFLWLLITSYSLISALSFAAVNRAEITDRKLAHARQYADLRAELDTKRTERMRLGTPRPSATIEAEIAGIVQSARWTATRQCAEAETREARAFCDRQVRLKAELGTAQRVESLDAAMTVLTSRLDAMPPEAAALSADPQLDVLKALSGLGDTMVRTALAVLVCLLVEMGSGLGLFVVLSCHRDLRALDGGGQQAEPTAPLVFTHDDGWAQARLLREARSVAGAAELYADYRLWTEARGHSNAMTVTAFGRWMSALGLERDRQGGRIVYRGVRLAATPQLIAHVPPTSTLP